MTSRARIVLAVMAALATTIVGADSTNEGSRNLRGSSEDSNANRELHWGHHWGHHHHHHGHWGGHHHHHGWWRGLQQEEEADGDKALVADADEDASMMATGGDDKPDDREVSIKEKRRSPLSSPWRDGSLIYQQIGATSQSAHLLHSKDSRLPYLSMCSFLAQQLHWGHHWGHHHHHGHWHGHHHHGWWRGLQEDDEAPPAWLALKTACKWSTKTSKFAMEGPIKEEAGGEDEEDDGPLPDAALDVYFKLERCTVEDDHWCCNEGKRFADCVPEEGKYACSNY